MMNQAVELQYILKRGAIGRAIIMSACLLLTSVTVLAESSAANKKESTGANHDTAERPGEAYWPGDAMGDISVAMDAAGKNDQRVLVIMGANWCHDSRALASRIESPPLQQVIDENYQVVFVDVGNLDKGKDVITHFGEPVYYATPTVLIADPETGNLVNADNRHQWGNAAAISMNDSVAYFEQMATAEPGMTGEEAGSPGELTTLLADIDNFEQEQANRVYRGYAKLTPMLEAYNAGDKDKFSEKIWNEVRDFRSQVPTDVVALQLEAHQRVAAGETGIQLNYPEYPPFSWEKKAQ